MAQDWLLSANYTRRDGEFHLACAKENVAKVLAVEEVKSITQDKIFVNCVYKFDGSSNIYSAALSYSLTKHLAINLFIERYQDQVDVLECQNTSYSLSYNYRYWEDKMKLVQCAIFALGSFLLPCCWQGYTQNLQVTVLDSKKNPIEYAVVYINEVLSQVISRNRYGENQRKAAGLNHISTVGIIKRF
ncbi:hypothetical protein [Colwellia piezophila]|uniref:hypothetical protein n=1 Tax=Colwellia piezophila TaxID=211668 RepID=UPI0003696166|nr:hypothetical protein [Colwellia piezophila]